jgi:hypothetical protein
MSEGKMKKVLSFFLCSFMAVSCLGATPVFAEDTPENAEIPYNPVEYVMPLAGQTFELANFTYTLLSDYTARIDKYSGTETNLVIPALLGDYPVTALKYGCFADSAIESVIFPATVTVIPDMCFWNCLELKTVHLPKSLQEIGNGAFRGCNKLTKIAIPATVTNISFGAFWDCDSLKDIDVNVENTKFCDVGGVLYTKNLQTLLKVPNTLSNNFTFLPETMIIGRSAFSTCKLKEITIPGTISLISAYAFEDCESLETVTINDGVSIIENHAFHRDGALKTVVLPESLTNLGEYSFGYSDGVNLGADKIDYSAYDLEIISNSPVALKYATENNLTYISNSLTAIYGDATGNGRVTISDLTCILRHIMTPEEVPLEGALRENANCYLDSKIDVLDVLTLTNYLLGKEEKLPILQ